MSALAIFASIEKPEPDEHQATERRFIPECVPLSWVFLYIHMMVFERGSWCYVVTEARVSVSISELFLADWMLNPLALRQTLAFLFNIVHKAR